MSNNCIMTQERKNQVDTQPKPVEASSEPCCGDFRELFPSRLMSALSDPNRIALLARLARCGRPCSVGELSECCPTDLSVVSRHLATLRDAGVLETEKRGRQVFYRVRYDSLSTALRSMAEAIEACCPPAEIRATGA